MIKTERAKPEYSRHTTSYCGNQGRNGIFYYGKWETTTTTFYTGVYTGIVFEKLEGNQELQYEYTQTYEGYLSKEK